MRNDQRPRYKVDLDGLQLLWAANYAGIVELLPQLQSRQYGAFDVDVPGRSDVRVRIVELGPYTAAVDIEQRIDPSRATPSPRFQLRVYHDARLAEVIASQGHRNIKPRYDYPNRRMYQRDEKYQVNRLFGEWLKCCLAQRQPTAQNVTQG